MLRAACSASGYLILMLDLLARKSREPELVVRAYPELSVRQRAEGVHSGFPISLDLEYRQESTRAEYRYTQTRFFGGDQNECSWISYLPPVESIHGQKRRTAEAGIIKYNQNYHLNREEIEWIQIFQLALNLLTCRC